ncbi:MAG: class II fructose-bisphosphate aldolase [Hasllibacter sp.]
MTLATLPEVLGPANAEGRAVAGLVVLGWEDARAYVAAAEAEGAPCILQAGPSCRAHTPLPVLGAMFRHLAEGASVPVVAHLDHGASPGECAAALAAGFTSVMFDGSRLPFEENARLTREVAEMARAAGAGSEGEIGFVGYAGGEAGRGTDPAEAARFAEATGVDAVAVSVGNVHLQERREGGIDWGRLTAIEAALPPRPALVIHGGSGVPPADRCRLARETRVAKVNIGTELRMAFGDALRGALSAAPDAYDRVGILRATEGPVAAAARAAIRSLR